MFIYYSAYIRIPTCLFKFPHAVHVVMAVSQSARQPAGGLRKLSVTRNHPDDDDNFQPPLPSERMTYEASAQQPAPGLPSLQQMTVDNHSCGYNLQSICVSASPAEEICGNLDCKWWHDAGTLIKGRGMCVHWFAMISLFYAVGCTYMYRVVNGHLKQIFVRASAWKYLKKKKAHFCLSMQKRMWPWNIIEYFFHVTV